MSIDYIDRYIAKVMEYTKTCICREFPEILHARIDAINGALNTLFNVEFSNTYIYGLKMFVEKLCGLNDLSNKDTCDVEKLRTEIQCLKPLLTLPFRLLTNVSEAIGANYRYVLLSRSVFRRIYRPVHYNMLETKSRILESMGMSRENILRINARTARIFSETDLRIYNMYILSVAGKNYLFKYPRGLSNAADIVNKNVNTVYIYERQVNIYPYDYDVHRRIVSMARSRRRSL